MRTVADITGQRFGMLVAVQCVGTNNSSGTYHAVWRFRCDCGREIERKAYIVKTSLRLYHLAHCGCRNHMELTGQRFGKLTVESFAYSRKGAWWNCRCDCGNTNIVSTGALRHDSIQSCGCLQREAAKQNCLNRTTHGMRNTRLYGIWHGIKQRCCDEHS